MTTKNKALVSMICGIVGIAGGFLSSVVPFMSYIMLACSIAGIVFGALALKAIKGGDTSANKGMAVAGLVLGIVACAIDVLAIACVACAIATAAMSAQ